MSHRRRHQVGAPKKIVEGAAAAQHDIHLAAAAVRALLRDTVTGEDSEDGRIGAFLVGEALLMYRLNWKRGDTGG